MQNSHISRRRFLATSAALVGAISLPSCATKGQQLNSFGIQLYTVRDQMKQDVAATLKAIASYGYKQVEFAGYFDIAPAEIKRILAGEGLQATSSHISLKNFQENLSATLDMANEIGHEYVVVPGIPKKLRRSLDSYKKLAEQFNSFGEEANKRGLRFGYHNHAFEFDAIDGITPYDLLLDSVEAVNMQFTMDLYWVNKAGQDPLAYFKKYPGRFEQCHVKDMDANGNLVDVGDGVLDFAKYFAQSKLAGLKNYYVENDRPVNSLLCAQKSAAHLRKLYY